MKKILLSIIYIFVTIFSYGQSPTFQWAKSVGGSNGDYGNSIATDASGNVYTVGVFQDTVDFDPGAGVFKLFSSLGNGFLSKIDASGNFVWAKQLGGSVQSVFIDATGNIFLTGNFYGISDFDPSAGIYNLTSSGSSDIYVAKLTSAGALVWAKQMGGTGGDIGNSISVDATGNIYTTGNFRDTVDFDPGAGVFDIVTSVGSQNAFISKLNSSGNFVWAKGFIGTSSASYSIAVTASGDVYTTGGFAGTNDFNPGAGLYNFTSFGSTDIFISKLDASGTFVWANQIGGSASDVGRSIAIDGSGNVCLTGGFQGTVDFDPSGSVYNLIPSGSIDIFVTKMDGSGNFVWAKNVGGVAPFSESGFSIAIDGYNSIYFTGSFGGSGDFDPGAGVSNLTSTGSFDIFVCKLYASGVFAWAQGVGGTTNDFGYGIAVNGAGDIFTTGTFTAVGDFDPGAAVNNLTSVGYEDIFVLKLHNNIVGIEESTKNVIEQLSVYPNPSSGIFNITVSAPVKNASIEIYNSFGALVYDQKIYNEFTTIDLTNQSNGLYFVKVVSDNKIVAAKRIVKQ